MHIDGCSFKWGLTKVRSSKNFRRFDISHKNENQRIRILKAVCYCKIGSQRLTASRRIFEVLQRVCWWFIRLKNLRSTWQYHKTFLTSKGGGRFWEKNFFIFKNDNVHHISPSKKFLKTKIRISKKFLKTKKRGFNLSFFLFSWFLCINII